MFMRVEIFYLLIKLVLQSCFLYNIHQTDCIFVCFIYLYIYKLYFINLENPQKFMIIGILFAICSALYYVRNIFLLC